MATAARGGAPIGHTNMKRPLHWKLTWKSVVALDEGALEVRLYGRGAAPGSRRPEPDYAWIDLERRKAGVTLELLHLEYLERHPDGYRYTQYCELCRRWLKRQRLVMRHVHRAGEKLFTDYAGGVRRQADTRAAGLLSRHSVYVRILSRWFGIHSPGERAAMDTPPPDRTPPPRKPESRLPLPEALLTSARLPVCPQRIGASWFLELDDRWTLDLPDRSLQMSTAHRAGRAPTRGPNTRWVRGFRSQERHGANHPPDA